MQQTSTKEGPDDGRIIHDHKGNEWRVHDFRWSSWRRWLMWLRVCLECRQKHIFREDGRVIRLERTGDVNGSRLNKQ